jgi:hypothetical protein
MMTPDPKRPETLLSVSNEIEAAAIATALAEYDIEAITLGGYTSGFRAEAPGVVAVVVRLADFDRARQALTEIRKQQAQIDWSKVDVRENAETPLNSAEQDDAGSVPPIITRQFWWTMEVLGVSVCLMIWLFTRQLTPLLIYVVTALALVGLFLALSPFAARRR